MPGASPVLVGFLYDYPQGDGGAAIEGAFRIGVDEVAATGRLDRDVEFVSRQAAGLPAGTEHDMKTKFAELVDTGCVFVVGPAISDNALIIAPLADAAGVPCINYTGGQRTRSVWMFHYQVGSLEEEPIVLAQRIFDRKLPRAAVVFDQSPVGRTYFESFEAARARLGLEVTGASAISPLTENATDVLARLRTAEPDVLVYLGLGVASRAVSLALTELSWDVPVVANSALMFGYARPDWRDGYAGWEYLDTIADDNEARAALAKQSPQAAAGPIGCAAYDMGRLFGEALARAEHLTRAGIADALRRVKYLPASSGYDGTLMGFGHFDHAALKGHYLVLREWKNNRSVQVST
jgi:branched-chain amino acid transport system substrate-binding protein